MELISYWCKPSLIRWTINFKNMPSLQMISNNRHALKDARAWRENTPVCCGLTRLVRAGYSRHDSGASRERARIMRHAQDGSIQNVQLLSRPVDFKMVRNINSTPSFAYFNHSLPHPPPPPPPPPKKKNLLQRQNGKNFVSGFLQVLIQST